MSYLNDPKIIFTGDFKSDVSTVNNDVRHYDNSSFQKRFQLPSVGKVQNGWWNPEGGANFTFLNCTVKKGFLPNGQIFDDKQDLIIGTIVSGSTDKPAGKMVDLDPQMQMTSELWALSIRFSTAEGELLLEGDLQPTGFRDLQQRQFPRDDTRTAQQNYVRNRQPLGASWTSVLTNLKWGSKANKSILLKTLKSKTQGGKLSVNLNGFGYYYSHVDGRFSMGKIIGTIAPWIKGEPNLFAPARRLYGTIGNYFGYINYLYDDQNKRVNIDLGNSLPINGPLGKADIHFPKIKFGISKLKSVDYPTGGSTQPVIASDNILEIGTLNLEGDPDWLAQSGGIISYNLSTDGQTLIKDHQLLLYVEDGAKNIVYARESIDGLFMRADKNVFRMDLPKDVQHTDFYAYQWGKPLPGAEIEVQLKPPMKGQGGGPSSDPRPPKAPIPVINIPTGKIELTKSIRTDKNGFAKCTLDANDLKKFKPRGYIDGQIYLYDYGISGVNNLDQYSLDWLFVHLRSPYSIPAKPTWKDVAPIWIQFGNLYPIMSKYIVDMSVREEVLKHKNILLFAFTRGINEPMYMPVTRDMSKGQINTLIKWLKDHSADEKLTKKDLAVAFKPQSYKLPKSLKNKQLDSLSEMLIRMTQAKGGDLDAMDAISQQVKS